MVYMTQCVSYVTGNVIDGASPWPCSLIVWTCHAYCKCIYPCPGYKGNCIMSSMMHMDNAHQSWKNVLIVSSRLRSSLLHVDVSFLPISTQVWFWISVWSFKVKKYWQSLNWCNRQRNTILYHCQICEGYKIETFNSEKNYV